MILTLSKNMTNAEIAELFREIAAVYTVQEMERFRTQAYVSVAASIEQFATPLKEMWEAGKLEEVPGVGKKFHLYLDELFRTGHIKRLEKILHSEPAGMFVLMDVPGVGPKTAYTLAKTFHLNNATTAVEKLKGFAAAGKIKDLTGFSEVSEKKILQAVDQHVSHHEARMLLSEAEEIADDVLNYLRKFPEVLNCEALGSLRRHASTVGDIDIAISTKQPEKVMKHVHDFPHCEKIVSSGTEMTIFIHASGWQVDVKTQLPEKWGSMLQHYTGSKLHNIHLRTLAKERGLSLSENGIKKGEKVTTYEDEKSFYEALGLSYIPPELREDAGEIEAARKKSLPKLIEEKDIRGDFHIHTNIDFPTSHDAGVSSVAEILKAAAELQYEYIGLSDHNPKQSEFTAAERLSVIKKRNAAIDEAIKNHLHHQKLRVFKGMEVDILPTGDLALEDEALELLDYVIVSIHSQFQQSRSEMTQRLLKALAHPKAKILGHPTGRLLQKRNEIECDWEEVFRYCAQHNKLLEINSTPRRLDLPAPLIRGALAVGARFVIDTDAHSVDSLRFMRFGVWEARRGWLEAKNVWNIKLLKEIEKNW